SSDVCSSDLILTVFLPSAHDSPRAGSLHSRPEVIANHMNQEGIPRREDPKSFAHAREHVRAALAAIGSGQSRLYIDCWAVSDDATLFGAWGPIEKGHRQLVDTFQWVGSRFSGGALVPEDVVAFESGDLAYTVGFERGEVSVDLGPARPMTIRVTHIYRRIDGEWCLIHRHADFPPPDQRRTATGDSSTRETSTARIASAASLGS